MLGIIIGSLVGDDGDGLLNDIPENENPKKLEGETIKSRQKLMINSFINLNIPKELNNKPQLSWTIGN